MEKVANDYLTVTKSSSAFNKPLTSSLINVIISMSIGTPFGLYFLVEIIIPQGTNTLFIYFLSTDYFFTPTQFL